MKVRILESSTGVPAGPQYVISYVVNDNIGIDAGALGFYGTPCQQAEVRHVFLTHTHIDHIASLPVFLENAFDPGREAVAVYGSPASLADLRKHVFNDVIWPDFVRLSTPTLPLLRLCEIEPETPVRVNGITITPVIVNHIVTTYGYIVTDGVSTVAFGGDSGPTDRIWQLLGTSPAPRSVFLEACFPTSMQRLAEAAGHLTPELVRAEFVKMPEIQALFAIHIKPRFYEETVQELLQLNLRNLVIGTPGSDYQL
jgi:ribonuclease BN (tRNA processing enzyme)